MGGTRASPGPRRAARSSPGGSEATRGRDLRTRKSSHGEEDEAKERPPGFPARRWATPTGGSACEQAETRW